MVYEFDNQVVLQYLSTNTERGNGIYYKKVYDECATIGLLKQELVGVKRLKTGDSALLINLTLVDNTSPDTYLEQVVLNVFTDKSKISNFGISDDRDVNKTLSNIPETSVTFQNREGKTVTVVTGKPAEDLARKAATLRAKLDKFKGVEKPSWNDIPNMVANGMQGQANSINQSKSQTRLQKNFLITNKFVELLKDGFTIDQEGLVKGHYAGIPYMYIKNKGNKKDKINQQYIMTPFVLYYVKGGYPEEVIKVYDLNTQPHRDCLDALEHMSHKQKHVYRLMLKNMTQAKHFVY